MKKTFTKQCFQPFHFPVMETQTKNEVWWVAFHHNSIGVVLAMIRVGRVDKPKKYWTWINYTSQSREYFEGNYKGVGP